MDLTMLQRFGPLIGLLNTPASHLTPEQFGSVAKALGGEGALNGLLPFLQSLAESTPDAPLSELLGTPEATSFLEKARDAGKMARNDSSILISCRYCGAHYEDSLSA